MEERLTDMYTYTYMSNLHLMEGFSGEWCVITSEEFSRININLQTQEARLINSSPGQCASLPCFVAQVLKPASASLKETGVLFSVYKRRGREGVEKENK